MWWAYAAVAVVATITLLLAPAGWGWRSLLTAAVALAALAGGLVMSLGHPRPAVGAGDVLVVAAQFDPGVTIWVWTAGDPPIAYALPWTDEAAEQLQEGLRMAEERGEPGTWATMGYAPGEFVAHPPPVTGGGK